MELLKQLKAYSRSERLAMVNGSKKITYRQLWERSDRLAKYIKLACGDDKTPIAVYGHKDPMMVVAFLACVKSGRAYVPIDTNVPKDRAWNIIGAVCPRLVFFTESMEGMGARQLVGSGDLSACMESSMEGMGARQLVGSGDLSACMEGMGGGIPCSRCRYVDLTQDGSAFAAEVDIGPEDYVKEDEVYYIIFTSGSTGNPKGVQITYGALNRFVGWALDFIGGGYGAIWQKRFLNQAPFSFDLSVMDLYMSLATESCLCSLDKAVQSDFGQLFGQLKAANVNVWVSTPSFADLCLADASFSQELLPDMGAFLFCGETLTNKTAANLLERFPKAQVYNMYGPTESTVAVTGICVDGRVNRKYKPLPVGKAKPGTVIKILDGDVEAPEGGKGEIVILGDTLSKGYFQDEEENKRAFFTYWADGVPHRAYRTGDKGYMQDGWLFYCGRLDLQVKLHGYRIEVEDVEENLMRVQGVLQAVVFPVCEEGKAKYLQAVCVYGKPVGSGRQLQRQVKEEMAQFVPEYMVPRKIQFVDRIPVTVNGKADRKKIQEMCGCRFMVD